MQNVASTAVNSGVNSEFEHTLVLVQNVSGGQVGGGVQTYGL